MADLNFTIGLSADGLIQGAAQAQRALDGMDKRAQALGRQMMQQQILMEQGADALRLYKIASANVSESDKKRLLQMELATQAAVKERAAQQERAAGVAQLQAAWAREEAAQNAKKQAIDKSIAAMQKEAAVLGKTAAAQKLYELQVQGATQAQLKQAAALQAQIAARQRLSQGLNIGISGNLGSAALAAVGIGGTAGILKAADEWTVFQNRLKLVTETTAELKEAEDGILAIAKRTGQELGGTAEVYQRLAANKKELALSDKELLQITETINKSIVVGGSTAEGASAALTQFGQAMASGVLRGEEFNSMMEQAPGLARALADGLGVGVGQLRNMANNGELTAERVTQALLKAGGNVDAQFKKMDLTIAQSATNFKTSLTEFVGKSNEASGAAKVLSGAIQFAAEHVDVLAAGITLLVALSVGKWAVMTAANVMTYVAALVVANRQGAATVVSQTATAAAIGRTGATAQLAAANVATFGGSLKALQLAGSAVSGALSGFAGLLPAVAAAAYSVGTALKSLKEIMNGGDGKNWASDSFDQLLDKLGLIDSRVETLGTKLAEISEKPLTDMERKVTDFSPIFGHLAVYANRWRESLTDGAKQLERAAAVAKTIQLQTGYTAAIGKVNAAGGMAAFEASAMPLEKLRAEIDNAVLKYREQAEQIGKTKIELEKMRLEAQKQAALKKEEAEAQKLYKDLPNAAQLVAEQLKNSAAQYDKSIASVVENMTLTERATRERTAAEKAQTAALERARAVTESLQGLRDNLARVGKTAQEIKLMDLADKGATAAQLAEAKALLEATAAKEKAYEAAQAKLSDAGGTMLKAAETMKGVAEQWNGEPDLLKGGSYIQQQWAAEKAKIDAANAEWEARYGKARSLASMVAESRQSGNGDHFTKLEAANETALQAAKTQAQAADVFGAAAGKMAEAVAKPGSGKTEDPAYTKAVREAIQVSALRVQSAYDQARVGMINAQVRGNQDLEKAYAASVQALKQQLDLHESAFADTYKTVQRVDETSARVAAAQVRAADVFEAAAGKVADATAKAGSANTATQSLPQVQQPQDMGRVTLDMRFPDGKTLTGVLFGEQAFIKQFKAATYKNIDGYIKDMHTALA